MSKVRITKEFEFEGAHALAKYDGKCRAIHGHSYKLFVTVKGDPSTDAESPKVGMLIDFSELKSIVNRYIIDLYDHALLLATNAPVSKELQSSYDNVIILDFQPTCENLVVHFADILKQHLPGTIKLFAIRLYETSSSYVEWFADDN